MRGVEAHAAREVACRWARCTCVHTRRVRAEVGSGGSRLLPQPSGHTDLAAAAATYDSWPPCGHGDMCALELLLMPDVRHPMCILQVHMHIACGRASAWRFESELVSPRMICPMAAQPASRRAFRRAVRDSVYSTGPGRAPRQGHRGKVPKRVAAPMTLPCLHSVSTHHTEPIPYASGIAGPTRYDVLRLARAGWLGAEGVCSLSSAVVTAVHGIARRASSVLPPSGSGGVGLR